MDRAADLSTESPGRPERPCCWSRLDVVGLAERSPRTRLQGALMHEGEVPADSRATTRCGRVLHPNLAFGRVRPPSRPDPRRNAESLAARGEPASGGRGDSSRIAAVACLFLPGRSHGWPPRRTSRSTPTCCGMSAQSSGRTSSSTARSRSTPPSSRGVALSVYFNTDLVGTLGRVGAATRKKDSYLQSQFRRLKGRRGPKKAIIAVAASMLTAVYAPRREGLPRPRVSELARNGEGVEHRPWPTSRAWPPHGRPGTLSTRNPHYRVDPPRPATTRSGRIRSTGRGGQ